MIATEAITIKEAAAAWLEDARRRLAFHTIDHYTRAMDHYQRFIEGTGFSPLLQDVRSAQLRSFLAYLETTRGIKPSSIQQYKVSMGTFFSFCVGEDWLDRNPISDRRVKGPRVPQKIVEPYSPADIARLLAAPWLEPGKTTQVIAPMERSRAVILTLLDTGIRASELCDLWVQDITFNTDGGRCRVRNGKGSKERICFFSSVTAQAIQSYLVARGSAEPQEPLFYGRHRKAMKGHALYMMIDRLSKHAGLDKRGVHRMRHTSAIWYLQNGGSLNALQRQLGHTNPTLTMRYAQLAAQDTTSAAEHVRCSPVAHLSGPGRTGQS